METAKETAPQNWRECRRLRAWELHRQGYKQQEIANALGLTQPAVSYIIKRANAGGMAAMRHHKPPGVPARLSGGQKQQQLIELAQGAEARGRTHDSLR